MSSLDVSSATQLNGDDMDHEEVMSPQLLDHSYTNCHGPLQTTYPTESNNAVQESSEDEDVKPNLAKLNQVKLEPISDDCSVGSSSPSTGSRPTLVVQDISTAVLGYIQSTPVNDVPYNVTHEDIAKALSVNDEKVPVRIMRKVIPCLRITAYMKEAEFVGKKKIKGLWVSKPSDWPSNVPYKDPNNGEKIDGKIIPKANSEELRMMFKFLKNKVMMNIHTHINQLGQDELDNLTRLGSANNGRGQLGQYYFNTPQSNPDQVEIPTPVRKHSPQVHRQVQKPQQLMHPGSAVYIPQYRQTQQVPLQKQAVQIKREQPIPIAPLQGETSIPTFVTEEFGNVSPEQKTHSSPETSINPNDSQIILQEMSDFSDDSLCDGMQMGIYHDEATGQQILVQIPPDLLEDSASFGSSTDSMQDLERQLTECPEMQSHVEAAVSPQPIQQQPEQQLVVSQPQQEPETEIRIPVKRQISVAQTTHVSSSNSGYTTNSGKRLKEESSISRGPIQQVSSPQQPDTNTEIEADIPQRRPTPQMIEPIASPQAPPSSGIMSHMVHPTSMPFAPTPVYTANPQQFGAGDYNRQRLLQDMHDRLRDKLMTLQNLVLGDVEISVALNKVYKEVIQLQFQRAVFGNQNQFIDAAHGCEALIDRAMMDGKNYARENFIEECNSLVKKYNIGTEVQTVKKTVLTVQCPDHPPIQANEYAKLQSKTFSNSPSGLHPKSPGTALSDEMGNLEISKAVCVDKNDPMQLGIKARGRGDVMAMLQNIVQPCNQIPVKPDDDCILPLPEKLARMDVEVDTNNLSQEVIDDMLKQLKAFSQELNSSPSMDDEDAIDIKKNKTDRIPQTSKGEVVPETQNSVSSFNTSVVKENWQPSTQHEMNIEICSQDEMLDGILELEKKYGRHDDPPLMKQISGRDKQAMSCERAPVQPATPDEGNIVITTSFEKASKLSANNSRIQQCNVPRQIKSYKKIQPKPYPSSQKRRESLGLAVNNDVTSGTGGQIYLPTPTLIPTSGSYLGLLQQQLQTVQQQQNIPALDHHPASTVYIERDTFGGGMTNSTDCSEPAADLNFVIPEVVENFEDTRGQSLLLEDAALRSRGRKRVHARD